MASLSCAIPLTNLSSAGGCGCKVDSETLINILRFTLPTPCKELLIGFETADDCAVYKLPDGNCLLFSTDFFTPIVDDPKVYGKAAAAHALSDIFAMGGRPILANSILGVPLDKIPLSIIQEIVEGGSLVMQEYGCAISGGHTIENPQPLYGFSVIGLVEEKNLKTNTGAQEGDLLLLTKPIGMGILAGALKLGLLEDHDYETFLSYLLEVNSCGFDLGQMESVHALTDVTGFGLVGHCLEMIKATDLSLTLEANKIEIIPGALELLDAVTSPESGLKKNHTNNQSQVAFQGSWTTTNQYIYFDPQTNGGLLIAVDPKAELEVQQILEKKLGRKGSVIGTFHKKSSTNNRLCIVS